jgi:hypothetical protein
MGKCSSVNKICLKKTRNNKKQPTPSTNSTSDQILTEVINKCLPKMKKSVLILGQKVYSGEVNKENQPHGIGNLFYSETFYFFGKFENGLRNGFGILTQENEFIFYGNFIKDFENGWGKIIYSDQSWFEGEFLNGQRHGFGKYLFPNGDLYSGEWVNGKMQGYGFYKFKSGSEFQGAFYEDNIHEAGIFQYENKNPLCKEFNMEQTFIFREDTGDILYHNL